MFITIHIGISWSHVQPGRFLSIYIRYSHSTIRLVLLMSHLKFIRTRWDSYYHLVEHSFHFDRFLSVVVVDNHSHCKNPNYRNHHRPYFTFFGFLLNPVMRKFKAPRTGFPLATPKTGPI